MVNYNVPRYSNHASELYRNDLFKFKLALSSVRSNTHMIAPFNYKLVPFQLQQLIWWKLYSFNPLWTMITTMFREKLNMCHISEPIIRRIFAKLVPLCSLSSSFHWFIHLCNEMLQHLARFWRRFRSVMWSIHVPFLSFCLAFLIFFLKWLSF